MTREPRPSPLSNARHLEADADAHLARQLARPSISAHLSSSLNALPRNFTDTRQISMYGRIHGSSSQFSNDSHADEAGYSADSHSFLQTLENIHLESNSHAGSSSSRAYSLVDRPPVVELSKRSFAEQAKAYHGDEIKHIAANPQEYSPHISDKAKRTKKVAKKYGTTQYDTANARYFRYQLGNKSVGLLRTEGGFAMRDVFAEEQWRKSFPGRNEVTSTVDLQIVHPLVDNAGDILLEHQLRLDGDNALLHSRPANREARARSLQLGFVDVDADNMVLDPTQHPEKWIKNRDDEWQRADKPGLYLSKAEDGDSQSETPRVQSEDEYDFM
ncbi:Effector protein NopP [Bradyrhizobium sp. CCGUVB23]|uniref:Effector protein NopP n=1 Tax=Bradyrhizobium sp. CCGUVB23 TaxID=2949630 RepID=UPI0020B34BAC|nr:Effector protein NopP [Bradyrhizobium sp. CCGUVB23]MCP3460779.1 Effector protein NopP [Bradyrhizobium sp. CCGUVB23]